MTDGPTADGLVNYLIYLVVALGSVVFATIQKHFGGRLGKVEDRCEENTTAIHSVGDGLKDELVRSERNLEKKLEARRLENKEDFRLLHKKVETGHAEILRELKRNGNSK